MKESIKKLLEKMNGDKDFAESILTQTEKEKVIELVRTEGIDLQLEDIDEVNALIQKALEINQLRTEGELSEEELENVAGGTIIPILMISTSLMLSVSATVSGMASVAASAAVSITITANLE